MKLNKIFVVALAVATLSSCDNDTAEDYPSMLGGINTEKGVMVSLPTQFTANENETLFQLPITVTGETNGKVVVTIKTTELTNVPVGFEPAKAVEHYNITSYTVNIPAGETEGYIEVYPVWEVGDVNDDRIVEVTIVSAQGATIGNDKCDLIIANVDDPYTAMCGRWKLTGTSMTDGTETTLYLNVEPVSASSPSYGSVLKGYGWGDLDFFLPLVNFQFDNETMTGTVEIGYGYMMSDAFYNFGLEDYAAPVCYFWDRPNKTVTFDRTYTCTFDGNYNEIVIPSEANVFPGLLYYTSESFSGYNINPILTNMTLTR